ncbi:FAD-binding oxidoreductase, partial [Pelomonas sp. KK5]|uniref:NAD(P)/FAD-dependent oxidoreductase n=1 Tax=Pelomonas sp. KK5 TaxID=1855730 RepID=UPI001301EDB7
MIGAGIAGASAAASLAAAGVRVVMLEAEAQPGYHSTGRSAALYSAIYGNATVRALSRASLPMFREQHPEALRPRDTLFLIGAGQQSVAEAFAEDEDVRRRTRPLDAAEVLARVPVLAPEQVAGALLDESSADIDVDLLHQGFLRQARAGGAELHCDARLVALERDGEGLWLARSADGRSWRAPLVVNAAGAWADAVAALAGIAPLGLQPLRRTAVLVDVPDGLDATAWPAVIAIDESRYFKPDAGLLLISPADETPSP